MDNTTLLIIGLVMYVVGNAVAYYYKIKYLHLGLGLLWFIPITQNENVFITIFSIIMFFIHIIITFYTDKESEF